MTVNHYKSRYGVQHGALTHTEQQAIKGQKDTNVKPFKWEKQLPNLFKNEKRETVIKHINIRQLLNIRFLTWYGCKQMQQI